MLALNYLGGLAGLLLVISGYGESRDPFQPLNLSLCQEGNRQLARWQLKGTLLSPLLSQALVSHPELGIVRLRVGDSLPALPWQLRQIEAREIRLCALPPCPAQQWILRLAWRNNHAPS